MFSVASGLAFYSGDLIGMQFGHRPGNMVEGLSVGLSLFVQLWIYPIWRLCDWIGFERFGDMFHTLIASLVSGFILFCLLRRVSRRAPRLVRGVLVVLLICSCGDIYSFFGDMRHIECKVPCNRGY